MGKASAADAAADQPATAAQAAASVPCAGAGLFVGLLALLHAIKPEVDPSWQMISEYAIGRFGWVMSVAFLARAVSCASGIVAARPHVHTRSGRVGLVFLLIAALGLTLAGLFTTDPSTATSDELTTRGQLHGWGFTLGVPGFWYGATIPAHEG